MEQETHACCFPECGKWLVQRLALACSLNTVQPGLYDVAVWRSWPPSDLPLLADQVPAQSGFQAIEQVMRLHKMRFSPHASAYPSGGQFFQVYRAFGIELSSETKEESEVSYETHYPIAL